MITEVRCSQLARPMVCSGFLSFENLPKSESGPAAEEGTAYGELVQRLLLDKPVTAQASNGIYFDDDMKFYARSAANEVKALSPGEIRCEQRIDWQTRSGIWIRGSYDTSFVANGYLYLDDDKYGWGIHEVKEHWQLLAYAIGEVIRRNEAFPLIILRIKQPRPHHEEGPIREWRLSYEELLSYKERIEQRMEMIAAGDKSLVTSKHCKYCAASGEACPAFNRLFYRALEVTTEFTQDAIDESELARQLDHVARAQEVIKIKGDSLNELAISRLKAGKLVPGYTTENRLGDRKWKNGVSPEVIKTLTGKDVVEQVMLSPAKAEKIGVPKDFVNSLVDRYFLGQRLVREKIGAGNSIFGNTNPSGGN